MRLKVPIYCVLIYYLSRSWCANLKMNVKVDNISWRTFRNDESNTIKDVKENNSGKNTKAGQFKYPINLHKPMNEMDTQKRNEVFAQITKEGRLKLESLGTVYKKHLNPNFNISTALKNVTDKYMAALGTYFNLMGKQDVKFGIDSKYYWLYVIETANRIFHVDSKILLDNINAQMNNSALEIDVMMLTEEMEKAIVIEKKDNIKYLCEKLEICIVYPSYSDHVAELLSEILKLPESNFQIIAKFLEEIVSIKAPFIKYAIDNNIYYKINSVLKPFCKSVRGEKELLIILRKIITQRYKIYKTNEDETKPTTMAVTILIELIDKMFETDGEDINQIKFDNILESLKAWPQGDRQDSDMRNLFIDFSNHFMDVVKFNLDEVTIIEEVKVLFELLVMGNSENNIVLDNLLAEGSKLVRRASDFSGLFDVL